jgi:hypothetical protein
MTPQVYNIDVAVDVDRSPYCCSPALRPEWAGESGVAIMRYDLSGRRHDIESHTWVHDLPYNGPICKHVADASDSYHRHRGEGPHDGGSRQDWYHRR